MINTGTISSLKFDDVCILVFKFPHVLVNLGQFMTPCSLVTMGIQDLRVLFFELYCQGLQKNAFRPNLRNLKNQLGTVHPKTVLTFCNGSSTSSLYFFLRTPSIDVTYVHISYQNFYSWFHLIIFSLKIWIQICLFILRMRKRVGIPWFFRLCIGLLE